MRSSFPAAEIEGWEALEGSFGLPDVNDEHVLAAAVIGGAGAVVTANLRDFPAHLIPWPVQILSPPDFVFDAVEIDAESARNALQTMAERSGTNGRPRRSVDELIDTLAERYGLAEAMVLLR